MSKQLFIDYFPSFELQLLPDLVGGSDFPKELEDLSDLEIKL